MTFSSEFDTAIFDYSPFDYTILKKIITYAKETNTGLLRMAVTIEKALTDTLSIIEAVNASSSDESTVILTESDDNTVQMSETNDAPD